MDILIGMVKATIKKLLKVAKSLVLSVVDAVRIISNPNASGAQKADSVFNLFGATVTNIVIEVLFEALEKGTGIPEFMLKPLQIITSVVCTNFTMLILQKLDLFDVRKGFKISQIKKMFQEEKEKFKYNVGIAEEYTNRRIEVLLKRAKEESKMIYEDLVNLNPKIQEVRGNLERINTLFDININFQSEWLRFLGISDKEIVN